MKVLKISKIHKPHSSNLTAEDFKRYYATSPTLHDVLAMNGKDDQFFETAEFKRFLVIVNAEVGGGTCEGQTDFLCSIFNPGLSLEELKQALELNYNKSVQLHAIRSFCFTFFYNTIISNNGLSHSNDDGEGSLFSDEASQMFQYLCAITHIRLKRELFGEAYMNTWQANDRDKKVNYLKFKYHQLSLIKYAIELERDEKLRREIFHGDCVEKKLPRFLSRIQSFCEINEGSFCFDGKIFMPGGSGHAFFLAKTDRKTFILYDSDKASFYEGSLEEVITELLMDLTKVEARSLLELKTFFKEESEEQIKALKKILKKEYSPIKFVLTPILRIPHHLVRFDFDKNKEQEFKEAAKRCEQAIRQRLKEEFEKDTSSVAETSSKMKQVSSMTMSSLPAFILMFLSACIHRIFSGRNTAPHRYSHGHEDLTSLPALEIFKKKDSFEIEKAEYEAERKAGLRYKVITQRQYTPSFKHREVSKSKYARVDNQSRFQCPSQYLYTQHQRQLRQTSFTRKMVPTILCTSAGRALRRVCRK